MNALGTVLHIKWKELRQCRSQFVLAVAGRVLEFEPDID